MFYTTFSVHCGTMGTLALGDFPFSLTDRIRVGCNQKVIIQSRLYDQHIGTKQSIKTAGTDCNDMNRANWNSICSHQQDMQC